ncbi:MAG: arsenate reductase [Chitinophagales bacterium]|nr:arsenate reductase [Chitinophagales bacterium]
MKKIYYLKTCSTCQRILKEINATAYGFELQNIKETPITEAQLKQLKDLSGTYEALFSRTAQKYKALDLKNKPLTEEDYKNYILEEYTFLKRPVVLVNNSIFIGSKKETVECLKNVLDKKL